MEKSRQFVIFGNFSKISFEDLNLLSDIKEKYNFVVDAQPDVPVTITNQPIAQKNISVRPAFKSLDNKTTVLFGSSRIHVQQSDSSISSYEDFNLLSVEIIKKVSEVFNLTINRLAINGTILITNSEKINNFSKLIFKDNKLFSYDSDEWQFRINNKEFSEEIDSEVNKILFFNRTKIINLNNDTNILLLSYDYNTQINDNKLFNIESVMSFNIIAKEFRNKVINM